MAVDSAVNSWRVDRASVGERLDRFLQRAMGETAATEAPSRRQIRRWIDQGRIQLGGRLCRVASRPLKAGQRVELRGDGAAEGPGFDAGSRNSRAPRRATAAASFELEAAAIVFEDAHLLVVDKPTGLASQATRDDDHNHLLAAAERWLDGQGGALRQGPWLHHRLDRGTSGLVVLAKSRAANRGLGRAFAERRVGKCYLTLVLGHPPAAPWQVDAPLLRVRGDGGRAMSQVFVDQGVVDQGVVDQGVMDEEGAEPGGTSRQVAPRNSLPSQRPKAATTGVTAVELLDGSALLHVQPRTGRMHQIRVHLASVGFPVLGDRLYGAPDAWRLPGGDVPRPMLHAMGLEVTHPVSGRALHFEVPPPPDMQTWIDRLRSLPATSPQPPKVP